VSKQRTHIETALKVRALADLQRSKSEISRQTGIARSTVRAILDGTNGWDKVQNDAEFSKYRKENQRRLQASLTEIAKQAIGVVTEKLDQASAAAAMTVAGISLDKLMVLSGQAMRVEHTVDIRADIKNLDALAAKLAQSLQGHRNEIDVTDVKTDDVK